MNFQVLYVKIQNFPSVEFQFYPRADLGFSRGGVGADFQKMFGFFKSTKLILRALLKH